MRRDFGKTTLAHRDYALSPRQNGGVLENRSSSAGRSSKSRRAYHSRLPSYHLCLRIVNILQIVIYLTTILTTINRQQKSVLPQKTFKRCATQPAPTSGDTFDSFACPFDLSTGIRPISLTFPSPLFPSLPGSRACRLTYHMFQNYEPRTHRDRIATLSHSFTDRTTKCPLIFFSLSVFRAFLYTRSLTLFRSHSRTRCLRFHFRLHFTHLTPYRIRRTKDAREGLHEIGFIAISHIIKDKFCFSLHITFPLQCNIKLS